MSFFRRRSSSRSSFRRSYCIERLEDRFALDGRLAITELMYQPPPPVPPLMADNFEFIEVQNIGDATISLGGMSFTSGVQFTFPAVDLVPGQFAIIAKDVASFRSVYGNGPNVLGAYTSGVLSNGGEPLTIERAGTIIVDFEYDGSWYDAAAGQSFSLVPADVNTTTLTPSDQLYWRPSAVAFGSPGAADAGSLAPDSVIVNELMAHTDQARGDWIELKNTTDQAIDIGGWFLSDSNDDLKKFRIPFGTLISAHGFITFTQFVEFDNANNPNSLVQFAFSEFGETAYLTQADNVGNLLGYRVSQDFIASDREVTFGQFVKSTGGTDFVYMQAETFGVENSNPRVEPIVINEILYAPVDPADEYIELRNLFDMPITLADPANPQNTWKFTNGVDFTFPQGAGIPASGFAIVVSELTTPAAFRTKYSIPQSIPIFGPYVGALSNQGEELELSKPGTPDVTVPYYRVDRVNYDTTPPWPDGTDVGGVSLAKVNSVAYGNDGANWQPGPVGGTPGAANVTIVTVSIDNTTVVEPNTGTATATLNISLSAAASQVVTVMYSTQDETTTAGLDYEAKLDSVTFQIGETLKQVTFTVLGDLASELDEEFNVQLSNVVGASLGDATGRVTIDDNDPQPTLSISDAGVLEGTSGTLNAVFVIKLSGTSGQPVSVTVETADGTATTGSDYATTSQLVEIAAGATTAQFSVPVNGDTTAEGVESFVVNLTVPTGATIGDSQGVGAIHETPPTAPWQNLARPLDSENNGTVSVSDALAMIAYVNANGSRILAAPVAGDLPLYLDVNGNNRVTPLDVLIIINFLDDAGQWPPGMGLAATAPMTVALAAGDNAAAPVETLASASSDDARSYIAEPQAVAPLELIVHEEAASAAPIVEREPARFNTAAVDAVMLESATGLAQRPSESAAGDDLFEEADDAGG